MGASLLSENITFQQPVGFPEESAPNFLQAMPFRAPARNVYARCAAIGPAE
jgi:hypothetical protein